MNVISFSLWGNKPMYLVGAIENIKLAKEIYPGWKCRFYLDSSVPSDMKGKIEEQGGEVVFIQKTLGAFHGMFWRFMTYDDPKVDIFISRDCDSRLNYREQLAVEEWLASGKGLHTMHDHPNHKPTPILGGMWGMRKGAFKYNLTEKIAQWKLYGNKGIDQEFLRYIVWPEMINNVLRHDGIGFIKWGVFNRFPSHPPLKFGGKYVGQIFDENNKPLPACPGME